MFDCVVCEPIQLTQAEVDKEGELDGEQDVSSDEIEVIDKERMSDGGDNMDID